MMLRKPLTKLLCTVTMAGLILSGCSSSESAESAEEDTNIEKQEVEKETIDESEPFEDKELTDEAVPEEEKMASAEKPTQDSKTSTKSSDEPEEMELGGAGEMSNAPVIPLNTKITWSTKEDLQSDDSVSQNRQWYAFETESGSEDLVYQIAIGGMASQFGVEIYAEGENEPFIKEIGNINGATKVIDLENLESEATYYIYLTNVDDRDYYILISTVSPD